MTNYSVEAQVSRDLTFNIDSYEFDYYSGSQIGVYFGDLLIDDIASINYAVRQSKTPIYSYASQYYHVVAPGKVLVQGTFTIPFKEAGYINLALANFAHKMGQAYSNTIPITTDKGKHKVIRQNIERLVKDETALTDKFTFYNDLLALKDDAFENLAEHFEDLLWKKGRGSSREAYNKPNYNMVPYNESNPPSLAKDSVWNDYRRADQYPPFDIWILYGDITNKNANHTIKKILRCEIIQSAQAIMIGGEPILEEYQFIAQNVV